MCLNLMSHKLMSPLAFFFSVWEDMSPIDYFSTGISSLIFFFNGDSSSDDPWKLLKSK